eukprot:COSAG01_NODE_5933_length_3945_cov_56.685647_3_plen_232_part_00
MEQCVRRWRGPKARRDTRRDAVAAAAAAALLALGGRSAPLTVRVRQVVCAMSAEDGESDSSDGSSSGGFNIADLSFGLCVGTIEAPPLRPRTGSSGGDQVVTVAALTGDSTLCNCGSCKRRTPGGFRAFLLPSSPPALTAPAPAPHQQLPPAAAVAAGNATTAAHASSGRRPSSSAAAATPPRSSSDPAYVSVPRRSASTGYARTHTAHSNSNSCYIVCPANSCSGSDKLT